VQLPSVRSTSRAMSRTPGSPTCGTTGEGFRTIRALPGGNACGGTACGSDADGGCGDGHFAGGRRARALVLNGHINAADPWLTPDGPHPMHTLDLRPRRTFELRPVAR